MGSTSVKAVKLERRGGRLRLAGVALADFRDGVDGEGLEEVVRSVLAECEARRRPCPIITALGGSSISVKHVLLPQMSRQAVAESIRWEARRHIPFGETEFVLDFQVLDGHGEGAELPVLLAAVETRALEDHLTMMEGAGVEPCVVDLVPLALINEVDEEGLLDGEAAAVVDLGASIVTVAVYKRNGFFFSRSFSIAQAVPRETDAPRAAGGVAGGPHSLRAEERTDEPEEPLSAPSVLETGWRKTAIQEVRRSLAFYNIETKKQGIGRIFLVGGRALEEGVAAEFQEALGIETAVLDPLGSVEAAVDLSEIAQQGPRLAVAMALARRPLA